MDAPKDVGSSTVSTSAATTTSATNAAACSDVATKNNKIDISSSQGPHFSESSRSTIAVTSQSTIDSDVSRRLKALHFGAGNIGRGFIGKVLSESGAEVTFADVVAPVIEKLNEMKEYRVRVVGDEERVDVVKNVCGINSIKDDVAEKVMYSDIITTAVGPNILPRLAAPIAEGIRRRYESKVNTPLNIICCENKEGASQILKKHVLEKFDENSSIQCWIPDHVGFVNCAVDRIVPPVPAGAGAADTSDPLMVTVESFYEWVVDRNQFVGPVPKIEGMLVKDNLAAFAERKLFTLNTGHCITAYLGYLKGYDTIDKAIEDEKIRSTVIAAMKESGEVLIKRYKFDREEHHKYIEKLLQRFRNVHLKDQVVRVAREPLRKLTPSDRLIKPLMGCIEMELPYSNLLKGVAAALHFSYEEDSEAVQLQSMIREKGLDCTIREVTNLSDQSVIAQIKEMYEQQAEQC